MEERRKEKGEKKGEIQPDVGGMTNKIIKKKEGKSGEKGEEGSKLPPFSCSFCCYVTSCLSPSLLLSLSLPLKVTKRLMVGCCETEREKGREGRWEKERDVGGRESDRHKVVIRCGTSLTIPHDPLLSVKK